MSFWVVQWNQKGPSATQRLLLKELREERWKRERRHVRKAPIHNSFVAVGFIHFHGFGVCCAKTILVPLGMTVNARRKCCVYCY